VVPAWVKGLVTKDTPVLGATKPDLVLVEFSDYECPYCTRTHNMMRKVMKKYGHRVRFYYLHYPLDNACNTTMRSAELSNPSVQLFDKLFAALDKRLKKRRP
jgi:protein-disulfide isomerase